VPSVDAKALLATATRQHGRYFEAFKIGDVYHHHWGRTIEQSDNLLFSTTTQQFNPIYFNRDFARFRGNRDVVVSPMLAFCVVFGLSVEDLSEAGGAFLGLEDLEFVRPVYPGDTLVARSTVIALRDSRSDKRFGIATWQTEGLNQNDEIVLRFRRTNMVSREVPLS
jgi:itaconyl-CoA hydratase